MRKTLLTTLTAALCAVAVVANAAEESSSWSPLTAWKTPWNWATQKVKPAERSTTAAASPRLKPAAPSQDISPLKHPVKYLGAAMSETPLAHHMGFGTASKTPKLTDTAQQVPDALALSTPTGPPSPKLFISLAELAERDGNVVEARQRLQQALAMWPTDTDLLRAAGRMEDRQGQLPLAEKLYRQAVTVNPQDAAAHNDLGLCLARQGRMDESVQEIEQAIHLQPAKALYRNNVATVLVELHQDQRALAHLSAVHGPAEANYNMGQLMVQRGRQQDAITYFQVALAQNPSLRQAETSIAMLQRNGATSMTPPAEASVAPYGSQPAAQAVAPQSPHPSAAPSAVPYVPDRYSEPGSSGVPDRYSGQPASSAPTSDYRASLPRHLPPVGSAAGQWVQ